MKNGNLYQELKTAKKDYKIAHTRELAMEKKFKEVPSSIQENMKPILIAVGIEDYKKGEKFWNLADRYKDYSKFFICDIVDIFLALLSYVEGERYVYIPIPHENFKKGEFSNIIVIIKEKINKQYGNIDYSILNSLYKNGDLIMIENGTYSMVELYNYVGEPNYRFGQFNYLREFVNRLIQYLIDNDLKNIKDKTKEELSSFMYTFISTHPNLVQKNKEKREQMLIDQRENDAVISECKKLELKLKK